MDKRATHQHKGETMVVYVVFDADEYSGSTMLDMFATHTEAEQYVEKIKSENYNPESEHYEIEKWEVNRQGSVVQAKQIV